MNKDQYETAFSGKDQCEILKSQAWNLSKYPINRNCYGQK